MPPESPPEAPDLLSLDDFAALARERLSTLAYDYYASGADDERTLAENRAAFERTRLAYRTLVDVSRRRLATTVLGEAVSMPVLVAPTAFQRLAHADGELAVARAAGAAGTVQVLSTLSTTPVEDVVREAPGPVWFQLYVYRDRGITEALVRRVEAAGCRALVLTVDAPVLGRRRRDERNRFHLPAGLAVANLLPDGLGALPPAAAGSGLTTYVGELLDPGVTWRDLDWLRSITTLPLVIKGLVRADDALSAADAGAAGIVVSNHGGRQLDSAPATLDALPRVVDALAAAATGDDFAVLLDGGVRRGTDVVKALALGARAVLVGRPVLWGLAVGGEAGVLQVLEMLRRELDLALALCGCPDVRDLGRDLIWSARPDLE